MVVLGLEVVVSRVLLVLLLVNLADVGAGLVIAEARLTFLIVATIEMLASCPHFILVHIVRAAVNTTTFRAIDLLPVVFLEGLVGVWVSHRVVVGIVLNRTTGIVMLCAIVAEWVRNVDVAVAGTFVVLTEVA